MEVDLTFQRAVAETICQPIVALLTPLLAAGHVTPDALRPILAQIEALGDEARLGCLDILLLRLRQVLAGGTPPPDEEQTP